MNTQQYYSWGFSVVVISSSTGNEIVDHHSANSDTLALRTIMDYVLGEVCEDEGRVTLESTAKILMRY